MIRVYIKDNAIVKTVNWPYIETEQSPEWSTYVDSDLLISDHIVYENGEIILYKNSQEMLSEKAELEAIEEKDEYQQEKLDYIMWLIK